MKQEIKNAILKIAELQKGNFTTKLIPMGKGICVEMKVVTLEGNTISSFSRYVIDDEKVEEKIEVAIEKNYFDLLLTAGIDPDGLIQQKLKDEAESLECAMEGENDGVIHHDGRYEPDCEADNEEKIKKLSEKEKEAAGEDTELVEKKMKDGIKKERIAKTEEALENAEKDNPEEEKKMTYEEACQVLLELKGSQRGKKAAENSTLKPYVGKPLQELMSDPRGKNFIRVFARRAGTDISMVSHLVERAAAIILENEMEQAG